MYLSYIKYALRNLFKQKLYTGINILGLSIGLGVCMMAYLYHQHEHAYEKGFTDHEQIVRLTGTFTSAAEGDMRIALTPYPLSELLKNDLPEVITATKVQDAWSEHLFKVGENEFYSDNYLFVDTSFFEIFDFQSIDGDPKQLFERPNQVVISENLALRVFGTTAAIGEEIVFENNRTLTVRAVLDQYEFPSHLQSDLYLQIRARPNLMSAWFNMFNYYTYAKLQPSAMPTVVVDKINTIVQDILVSGYVNDGNSEADALSALEEESVKMEVQKMADVHLGAKLDNEIYPGGNRNNVYLFLFISGIILFIACINFMNLATARSANRAKEIGVRKVIGATRFNSSIHLLVETFLQSFIAVCIGLILLDFAIPYFNIFASTELVLDQSVLMQFIPVVIIFLVLATLLAGLYPALFLSGFKPVKVLNGDFSRTRQGAGLRKGLVIFQFVTCGALILFMLVVSQQIDYMKNKDLGFSSEQVIVVPVRSRKLRNNTDRIKNTLLQHPNVLSISIAENLPGDEMGGNTYDLPNGTTTAILDFNQVDKDYLDVTGIKLVNGRFFNRSDETDSLNRLIVNEKFVQKYFADTDPIGQQLNMMGRSGEIIGVVKNFHWRGFNDKIEPTVFHELDAFYKKAAIKVSGENLAETISFVEKQWRMLDEGFPPRYTFLDEKFSKLYAQHINFGSILLMLNILIILIAMLGLFGLATYTAEQRIKEIGVRKVLGASAGQIAGMLVSDFTKTVFFAVLISLPIGYWISISWLQDFAYRVDINILLFIFTLVIVLLISMFTVGAQAWRSASLNPVDALRDE